MPSWGRHSPLFPRRPTPEDLNGHADASRIRQSWRSQVPDWTGLCRERPAPRIGTGKHRGVSCETGVTCWFLAVPASIIVCGTVFCTSCNFGAILNSGQSYVEDIIVIQPGHDRSLSNCGQVFLLQEGMEIGNAGSTHSG